MMKGGSFRSVAAGALAVLGLAGCSSGAPSEAAGEPNRVVEAHGYEIESTPENAAQFFMNDHVFDGTVVEVGADVLAWDDLDDGGAPFEFVYTPVLMRVDDVAKGGLEVGEVVTVRAMGGTAGGLRYEVNGTDKSEFVVGSQFVVFAGEYSAVSSETEPAMTSHFLYVADGDVLRDVTYGSSTDEGAFTVTVERMDSLIAAAAKKDLLDPRAAKERRAAGR